MNRNDIEKKVILVLAAYFNRDVAEFTNYEGAVPMTLTDKLQVAGGIEYEFNIRLTVSEIKCMLYTRTIHDIVEYLYKFLTPFDKNE